jgi:hypothetical protein
MDAFMTAKPSPAFSGSVKNWGLEPGPNKVFFSISSLDSVSPVAGK